jgi:hypothetical protein
MTMASTLDQCRATVHAECRCALGCRSDRSWSVGARAAPNRISRAAISSSLIDCRRVLFIIFPTAISS